MHRQRRRTVFGIVLVGFAACAACHRGEPPAPDVDAAVAPLPGPAVVTAPSLVRDGGPSGTSVAQDAGSSRAEADGGEGRLGQTRDRPAPSSDALTARAKALFDAVVRDEPDAAMPFFFPLTAYEQVKDVGNPAADWKRRLVAAYARDIHALHETVGGSASFVRLEVPDARARWVEPGDEYNKIGYWRVYRSRIVYAQGDRERSFDLSSLISWRGEWYVVHLTGFK